ncbi:MAG TPA: fatty acid desaturase [Candidatus Xenobia bacterium]|nr:fatty acid desaturase [Candidatus Xenobia bacterium]
MSQPLSALPDVAFVPDRDQFDPTRVAYLIGLHVATVAVFWHTTWAALGLCLLLHAVIGGMGMCVGFHRLLTHRSFKCPRWLEYTLALLGTLCLQGGPIEWVAQHRQHHQHADEPGDPHSARQGFWWSHMLWILWAPPEATRRAVAQRYAPDLLRVPFYVFLERTHFWLSVLLGIGLYLLGGWPFVVWGLFVRLVITYHCTWLVNSASHTFGYRNFAVDDLSTNCWWVALLSYGEGWHNNHHAFPTSSRHGLRPWEVDFSYAFIRSLQLVGLAWDLRRPPIDKLRFKARHPSAVA